MGNTIPPCVLNTTSIVVQSPYELTWLKSCDPWIVAHFLAPFWLTVFTRSFTLGFFFTHLWETIELLFQSLFGSFVFFADANDETEGLAYILEDILEGLFACLLGKVFLWVYPRAPRLLNFQNINPDNDSAWHPWRFILYGLSYLAAIAPGASILGIRTGLNDEIPLGLILYTPIFVAGMLPIVLATSHWEWWPRWAEYWITGLVFTIIMGVQHIWDYLYSRAIQSWVYAVAFLLYLLCVQGARREPIR